MKIKLNRIRLRVLIIILIAAVVLCAVFLGIRALDKNRYQVDQPDSTDLYKDEDDALTYIDGKWYAKRKNIETVLLIGLDKFEDAVPDDSGYVNNQQSDFLFLLLLDHENKTYTSLHINRDSMAEIQRIGVDGRKVDTITAQLALAHTYGSGKEDSCKNTVSAVSGYLYGTQIDHYISLTMDAVADVNDMVGGVTVTVLDDFTPVDKSLVKGTDVTLAGSQALTYVRARGGLEDSSNVRRMERQRQYLHALHRQVEKKMAESDDFLLSAILDISPYLVSDCTINQLADIGNSMLEYSGGDIRTIEGEAVKGEKYMEFYADEDALRDTVLELFYTEAENAE